MYQGFDTLSGKRSEKRDLCIVKSSSERFPLVAVRDEFSNFFRGELNTSTFMDSITVPIEISKNDHKALVPEAIFSFDV